MEGAIEEPREVHAPWSDEEHKGHEQDRGCWGYFDGVLISMLACHIVLPPWRLWRCCRQYTSLDFGTPFTSAKLEK